ncbi:MAG: PQQ-dependent sugar dehydrogenase [Rhodospirillales bacterium]|nr:PQQ-dependent sugar dehydrogenase [Rhodospirillales bacterium]
MLLLLPTPGQGAESDRLIVAPGFKVEVFAKVPRARSLAVANGLGVVFVGTRGPRVYAVEFRPRAPKADKVSIVRRNLKVANGIAWKDGHLYVAEQHRVIRFAGNSLKALARARPEILSRRLPDKRHHGWRYAKFGPDGRLYVTIGAPCNVCEVEGLEGTIIRLFASGGKPEIFARGIRNSVGLDFHPKTGQLFFTDNGADYMGDDSPPDELNHAPGAGLHFGYPWFGGGTDRTPAFRSSEPPPGVTFPVVSFGAHVAALGVHFYRGRMFPAEFTNDAFVAQHGSWNRSVPDGYRVVRVRFDNVGNAIGYEPFIEGWLRDGKAWGRPVDVAELADGSLLVSDDASGTIWRITH